MSTIRIGTNPIAWSNDDLRSLGGETPLEQCLAEAKQAGFSGIELGHKFPRDAKVLKPILAAHDLALVSGWYSMELSRRSVAEELEAIEPHLTLLKAMGCDVVILAETAGCIHGDIAVPLSRRPVLDDATWALFCERLTTLANALARRGFKSAYHHHMGTVVEAEGEVDRLMADTGPALGLLLDSGHMTVAGGDPLAVARRHAGRITHVHCKDVRADRLAAAQAADSSFLAAVVDGLFTVPGDGMVAWRPLLADLAQRGYSGWLVVEAEQDPAKAHPLTYARKGYDFLSSTARAAGFSITG